MNSVDFIHLSSEFLFKISPILIKLKKNLKKMLLILRLKSKNIVGNFH